MPTTFTCCFRERETSSSSFELCDASRTARAPHSVFISPTLLSHQLVPPPTVDSPQISRRTRTHGHTPPMPSLTPFSLSLLLRFLNAVLSRAFFQPDEYWQSLEVAHHLVFGYGCKSWEWRLVGGDDLVGEGTGGGLLGLLGGGGGGGIRSPLYPLVFVPVYWAVKVLGLEETGMLVSLPGRSWVYKEQQD